VGRLLRAHARVLRRRAVAVALRKRRNRRTEGWTSTI
jgi:hypothetical protein